MSKTKINTDENGNMLILERVFDATIEQVWEACADEEKFSQWWGQPKEGSMPYHKMNFEVGGSIHFKVVFGDIVVWAKSIFEEIVPLEKIVMSDYYSDENGKLIDNSDYPKSTITLLFESMGDKTKLKVIHEGIGKGKHKIEEYAGGWNGSLDKLEEELQK